MPRVKTLAPRITAAPARKAPASIAPGRWRPVDASSTARGYGYKWQQARAQFLASNPLCVMCAETGRDEVATVVDHIEAHRGDQSLFWNRRNWQALCAPCHSSRKQREENAQRYGAP